MVFTDWYKPGYKAGGPIRSVSNIVAHLSDQANFFIVTRNTDYLEVQPYPGVVSDKWIKTSTNSIYYLSAGKTDYQTIKGLIREIKPDLVYTNSLYSPFFTLIPIFVAKHKNIKSILAPRGMLSGGALAIKKFKKQLFLMGVKLFLGFRKTVVFHATNEIEKNDIIRAFGENVRVTIANNLAAKKETQFTPKEKKEHSLRLASIARIAPEKNTLYAIETLKHCTESIVFDIYGPTYDVDYWKRCQSLINQLPSNIVVNYKGALANDLIDKTLQTYHALFLPSTGENYGHVIVEAMINSCIPVISNKTPWQDFEEKNAGIMVDLSDQSVFSKKIDELAVMDEKQWSEMARNAHKYADDVVREDKAVKAYHHLFEL